jgi:hypothetical protein
VLRTARGPIYTLADEDELDADPLGSAEDSAEENARL